MGGGVVTVTRPVLRWFGGKWTAAPRIIEHFPKHRCYVEPFGGAGSVLLRKPRSYAEVWNDVDGEVVNLFRVLRDPDTSKRLVAEIEMTPFARAEFVESYEMPADPVERARRTVVRSFMGFGSVGVMHRPTGFRSNSNRSGTTPARDWYNYPQALELIIERLRGVVIENRDFADVIRSHDAAETLIYADPPYVEDTRSSGAYRHDFVDADHERLAETLHAAKGMVILSGYRSDLYDRLFAGWRRISFRALADGARERVEVLWLNPAATAAAPMQELIA